MISIVLFRDRASEIEEQKEKSKKTKIWDMIKGVVQVPSFLALVIGCCCSNIGYGIVAVDLMYYLIYVLQKPELMALLLPATYIGTLAGSIAASFFAKFEKKKMKGNTIGLLIGYGLMAATSSVMVTFLQPALIDCAEYTEYKTGIKCQALTLTGFTFVSKMTAGFAAAILGFALQFAKYDGQAVVQSAGAVSMIKNMMFWPVIIAAMIGIVILAVFYRLDEKTMDMVRKEIRKEK